MENTEMRRSEVCDVAPQTTQHNCTLPSLCVRVSLATQTMMSGIVLAALATASVGQPPAVWFWGSASIESVRVVHALHACVCVHVCASCHELLYRHLTSKC